MKKVVCRGVDIDPNSHAKRKIINAKVKPVKEFVNKNKLCVCFTNYPSLSQFRCTIDDGLLDEYFAL